MRPVMHMLTYKALLNPNNAEEMAYAEDLGNYSDAFPPLKPDPPR
jgi:hypothetical protein